MFDKKRTLIWAVILYIMGFGLLIPNIIYCYSAWHEGATAIAAVSGILLLGAFFLTVVFVRIYKKENAAEISLEKFKKSYDSIRDYGKVGIVHRLARNDTAYSATGKFALIKRFNGINGYHLALEIRGNKPLSSNDKTFTSDKDAKWLFKINIGYHDEVALSVPENYAGIVLESDDLQGKTIPFSSNNLYTCNIETEESDEIDNGVIEIIEWNETNRIIAFKCIVAYGDNAVYYGKLNLQCDDSIKNIEFDEEKYAEWLTEFEPLSKPGAKLKRTRNNTFSGFGGMPTVPKGFEWPTAYNQVTNSDVPIPFLLQIDFSEIGAACKLPDFPGEGLLYVFVDNENYDYKLLYFNKPDNLTEAKKPDSLDVVYKKFHVSASAVKTYPDESDNDAAQKLCDNPPCVGADNVYAEMQKNTLDDFMLGGWASHVQEGGFIKELHEKNNGEWMLLMQIVSSDNDENFMWGDAGTLYFYIRKEDLKALDFGNVEMDMQCY